MADLERITITIEPDLLARLDAFLTRSGHSNRSKAIGDFVRAGLLEADDGVPEDAEAVGVVAVTYDHERREMADKLVHMAHDHEGMVLATTHIHLDAHNCLEMSALRGTRSEIRHFAEHVSGLRGVHHGGFLVARPVNP
jgi:CopG family transcriptional regulator, nickel-responsive regulator